MRCIQPISLQGGKKRGRCASNGVRCLEKIDFIGSVGASSGVKCLSVIISFQCCSRWLQWTKKTYKFFMWKGQKYRRTCHEKFVNVGSGSDIFAGRTFTIEELTPLELGKVFRFAQILTRTKTVPHARVFAVQY